MLRLSARLRRWRLRRLRRTRVRLIDVVVAFESEVNRLGFAAPAHLIAMRDDVRRQIAEIDRLLGERSRT